MTTFFRWSTVLFIAYVLAATAAPVREIEITPDPVLGDTQVFTVRITPGETCVYDKMLFACFYHQEFASQATETRGAKVVHEPEFFTYRRRDVKLVDDLDTHISFRVPISRAKLVDMFGVTAFNTNAPVTIAHIVITAYTNESRAWSYDLKAEGLRKFDDTDPAPSTSAASATDATLVTNTVPVTNAVKPAKAAPRAKP